MSDPDATDWQRWDSLDDPLRLLAMMLPPAATNNPVTNRRFRLLAVELLAAGETVAGTPGVRDGLATAAAHLRRAVWLDAPLVGPASRDVLAAIPAREMVAWLREPIDAPAHAGRACVLAYLASPGLPPSGTSSGVDAVRNLWVLLYDRLVFRDDPGRPPTHGATERAARWVAGRLLSLAADAIRDVFPGPGWAGLFTPNFDPAWRTTSVHLLARQARETGDRSALPILADALQDAGCDDAILLNHLRHHPRHGPACWALAVVAGESVG